MNNTIKRAFGGALFLIVMIGSILWSPVAFAAVMLICIYLMMKEFLSISLGGEFTGMQFTALVTGTLMYTISFVINAYKADSVYLYLLSVPLAIMLAGSLFEKDRTGEIRGVDYQKMFIPFFSIIYIALPFSLTNTILFSDKGLYSPYLLLSVFILLWVSDVGAYVFGMAFGQKNGHKLYPAVSPKKSWEGVYGGVGLSLLTAYILHYTGLLPFTLVHVFALGLIVPVSGIFGDLAESLFKRNFGVKDSGNVIPGHGGLLDRFDGAILAIPLAITYLKLFNLIKT